MTVWCWLRQGVYKDADEPRDGTERGTTLTVGGSGEVFKSSGTEAGIWKEANIDDMGLEAVIKL